jgi:hypothetical protein
MLKKVAFVASWQFKMHGTCKDVISYQTAKYQQIFAVRILHESLKTKMGFFLCEVGIEYVFKLDELHWTGSLSTPVFAFQHHSSKIHNYIRLQATFIRRTSRQSVGNFQQSKSSERRLSKIKSSVHLA